MPVKKAVVDGAMNPILLGTFDRHGFELAQRKGRFKQIDSDRPARIVECFDFDAMLMLPVAIAPRVIKILQEVGETV